LKITHYMTLDVGTGPVSLVEIRAQNEHVMLRISHRAAFDAVKEIDPEQARAYVSGVRGARYMRDDVDPEHDDRLNDEIAKWAERRGERVYRIRWQDGRHAKILSSLADLDQFDAANAGLGVAPTPRRSSRVML
jgi:hypothetical protein